MGKMPPPAALLRSVAEGAVRGLWKRAWRERGAASAAADGAQEGGASLAEALEAQREPYYDVAVVGGGIVGSCTAYELAKQGQRVACLEQHDWLHAKGSSHGHSRIIRRTYPQSHHTKNMGSSYALWESAQREAGTAVCTRTGGLDFGVRGNEALRQLVASSVEHGVAHELLTPEQVAQRFPAFRLPPHFEAVFHAEAGVLNATKACAMFQQLARTRGAHLLDRTRVLAVTPGAGGVRVDTSRGTLRAGKVVVAAGAWAAKLLGGLGVHVGRDALCAVPVAVSYWRCSDDASAALLAPERCPVAIGYTGAGLGHHDAGEAPPSAECYLLPSLELPGLVKISLHLPQHLWGLPLDDPDVRNMAPPEAIVREHVTPFIQRHLPGVDSSAPAIVESCLYTMTADHDFVLADVGAATGTDACRSIFLASPCSGHGFKFAPLVGALLPGCALRMCAVVVDAACNRRYDGRPRSDGDERQNGRHAALQPDTPAAKSQAVMTPPRASSSASLAAAERDGSWSVQQLRTACAALQLGDCSCIACTSSMQTAKLARPAACCGTQLPASGFCSSVELVSDQRGAAAGQPERQREAARSRSLSHCSSAPQTTSGGKPMPRSFAILPANSATCDAAHTSADGPPVCFAAVRALPPSPTIATASRTSSALRPARACRSAASANACTRASSASPAALEPAAPCASASARMRRSYVTSTATGGSPGGAGGARSRKARACAAQRGASESEAAGVVPAPSRARAGGVTRYSGSRTNFAPGSMLAYPRMAGRLCAGESSRVAERCVRVCKRQGRDARLNALRSGLAGGRACACRAVRLYDNKTVLASQ